MQDSRYKFQKYSAGSKEHCPACGQKRCWTRYVDTHTGELLPAEYGYCDHAGKCGHKLSPYAKDTTGESYSSAVWKSENSIYKFSLPKHKVDFKPQISTQKERIYFDKDIAESTLKTSDFRQNDFVMFVMSLCFSMEQKKWALDVLLAYKVGTFDNHCVFWFVDNENRYHAGQAKTFNRETGKTTNTNWIHYLLHRQNPNLVFLEKYKEQDSKFCCLFGEHLLALPENKGKTIVLVESPKNALLSTIFLPQDDKVYLATYSLSTFTKERCNAVLGRKILLLPDVGAEGKWEAKAPEILPKGSYSFMTVLEGEPNGFDIADAIIRELRHSTPEKSKSISYHELCAQSLDEFWQNVGKEVDFPQHIQQFIEYANK